MKFSVTVSIFMFTVLIMFGETKIDQPGLIALLNRVEAKINPSRYFCTLSIKNFKPQNHETTNKVKIYRSKMKSLLMVTEPAIQYGQIIFRDKDDMWLYLPKSQKTMRVGAKDNTLGGEASNVDLLAVEIVEDYDALFLGMEEVDGTSCYKIELKGKKRTVAYDKIIYWISEKSELPVKREFYSLSGTLLKTMYYNDITQMGPETIPVRMVIENEKNKGYVSEVTIELLDYKPNFSDNILNISYIESGRVK